MSSRRRYRRLAVALAVVLVAFVAFIFRPEGDSVKAMGDNRTTTSRDGTVIAFTKLGSGPPLILVDGAFCYRENGPSSDLARLLAPSFTVLAYDRRGRGESSDKAPYALDKEVDDLRALVDEAGGSAALLGISSGAALAMQAVARGVKVTRLVLYEPPFVGDDGHAPSSAQAKAPLDELVSAGDRAGSVKFFLRTSSVFPPRSCSSCRSSCATRGSTTSRSRPRSSTISRSWTTDRCSRSAGQRSPFRRSSLVGRRARSRCATP